VIQLIKRDVWFDKLSEDKAKYFNRQKMSIDLFARYMETSANNIEMTMFEAGYVYLEDTREFIKRENYRGRLFKVSKCCTHNI